LPEPDRIRAQIRILKEGTDGIDRVPHRRLSLTYLGDNTTPKVNVQYPGDEWRSVLGIMGEGSPL
jgi:hypothetical protein